MKGELVQQAKVITTDLVNNQIWASQFYELDEKQIYFHPGEWAQWAIRFLQREEHLLP